MLYTKKGDSGTTKLFNCEQGQRVSKADFIFEVLGNVDELNCSIGYAKAISKKKSCTLYIDGEKVSYEEILEKIQNILFCIQAELGGSNISITEKHTLYLEKIIYEVETTLPPITSFIVPGGGEMGAYLDVLRTITRRTERALVLLKDRNIKNLNKENLTFMNRLSSVFYALARFANYQEGHSERKPGYEVKL